MSYALGYRNYMTEPGGEWLSSMGDMRNLDGVLTPNLSERIATVDDETSNAFVLNRRFAASATTLPVQIVAVLGHDFPADATVGYIRLSVDSTLEWESTDLSPLQLAPAGFPRHWVVILPTPVAANTITVSVVADGRMSAGHIWAGPLWRPPETIARSWSTRVVDPSEVTSSRSGAGYSAKRAMLREHSISLEAIPREWAFGNVRGGPLDVQRIQRAMGATSHVISLPRTTLADGSPDPISMHRVGLFGRASEMRAIEHIVGDQYRTGWTIRETL